MNERERLVEADEHIAWAKERIAQQQKLIEDLAAGGHDPSEVMNLLHALQRALRVFELHRETILARANRPD
jgi:hypothetical protein